MRQREPPETLDPLQWRRQFALAFGTPDFKPDLLPANVRLPSVDKDADIEKAVQQLDTIKSRSIEIRNSLRQCTLALSLTTSAYKAATELANIYTDLSKKCTFLKMTIKTGREHSLTEDLNQKLQSELSVANAQRFRLRKHSKDMEALLAMCDQGLRDSSSYKEAVVQLEEMHETLRQSV